MHAFCGGILEISDKTKQTSSAVSLFLFNMTVLFHGKMKDGPTPILIGRDAILSKVMKDGGCMTKINVHEIGPNHEFDLRTGERKILDFPHHDLCNGTHKAQGEKEVSEFLINYLSKIDKTVSLDKEVSPIDYDQATKLLKIIRKSPEKEGMFEALFNLFKEEEEITFQHSGKFDDNGNFHGYTVLKILPTVTCVRGSCDENEIGQIRGNFNHGTVEGLVTLLSPFTNLEGHKGNIQIDSIDNIQLTYIPVTDGIVHGIVMTFGMKRFYKVINCFKNSTFRFLSYLSKNCP